MTDDTTQNPFAGQDLDTLYRETIDQQRSHLLGLQETFNKRCESAKVVAQEKLKALAPEDNEGKKTILQEQKATLEALLKELKHAIDESTRTVMKRLEEINVEREKKIIADLEKQLATL